MTSTVAPSDVATALTTAPITDTEGASTFALPTHHTFFPLPSQSIDGQGHKTLSKPLEIALITVGAVLVLALFLAIVLITRCLRRRKAERYRSLEEDGKHAMKQHLNDSGVGPSRHPYPPQGPAYYDPYDVPPSYPSNPRRSTEDAAPRKSGDRDRVPLLGGQ